MSWGLVPVRLDLERAVARAPEARVAVVAVDTVPAGDVVDEGVTYKEMSCGGDTVTIPSSAALLFCWGACTCAGWHRCVGRVFVANTVEVHWQSLSCVAFVQTGQMSASSVRIWLITYA